MQRLRLYDLRNSRLPALIGICQDDIPQIAQYTNTAQRRLLYCREAGDESWFGSWAEILFYVSQTNPYITLPRGIARLESVNVCSEPVAVQNQFYEYLNFGNGRMPKCRSACGPPLQVYSRNNAVTFTDLSSAPQLITIFSTPLDDGKRVFLQGTDQNGTPIVTQDNGNVVRGIFVSLQSPFVTAPLQFNELTGIQKDQTIGDVQFWQTDPTSAAQVLLLTMEPSETTAAYRRYFLNPLPRNCCPNTNGTVQNIPVTAIAKLDLIPVRVDTDYCLLQNMEAIIEECQSVRLSQVDNPASKQMAAERHREAVRMLNGELAHFLGVQQPAINFAPFGSATLDRQRIGRLM